MLERPIYLRTAAASDLATPRSARRGTWRRWIGAWLLLLQISCAATDSHTTAAPLPSPELGTIGLVVGHRDPEYASEALLEGKGEGVAAGAAAGALNCLSLLQSCDPSVMCALLALVCVPVGAVAGAVYGGVTTAPAAAAEKSEELMRHGVAALKLAENLRRSALDYASKSGFDLQPIESPPAAEGTAAPSGDVGATPGVDTVLALNVEDIRATSYGTNDLPVQFVIRVTMRLIDAHDGHVRDTYSYDLVGPSRPASEWLANDGALLEAEFHGMLREFAVNAIDDLMIYRPAPRTEEAPKSQGLVPGYALAPLDPPLRRRLVGFHPVKEMLCGEDYQGDPTWGGIERYRVGSFTPAFSWESLPSDFDREAGDGPGRITDLRYDFRLFGENGFLHERFGLDVPRYALEQPLAPCAQYRWTVRARFKLDGRTRATEWTGGYDMIGLTVDPRWIRGWPGAPALAFIPKNMLLYFPIVQTPGAGGSRCKCQ